MCEGLPIRSSKQSLGPLNSDCIPQNKKKSHLCSTEGPSVKCDNRGRSKPGGIKFLELVNSNEVHNAAGDPWAGSDRRRHNQRRNGRHSRSPEAPRNRKSAESEGEDERRAAEERRRKRKTAFDDAPAAAASAAPQQTAAQIGVHMQLCATMCLCWKTLVDRPALSSQMGLSRQSLQIDRSEDRSLENVASRNCAQCLPLHAFFVNRQATAAAMLNERCGLPAVMGMMGAGGMPLPAGMLNAEQKKKLLWGKKAVEVEAAPVSDLAIYNLSL